MTEDTNCETVCCRAESVVEECAPLTKAKAKGKRDIIRFNGSPQIAVNLDHVTHMVRGKEEESNRITFNLYSTGTYVDFEDEESAKTMYEAILNLWAGE